MNFLQSICISRLKSLILHGIIVIAHASQMITSCVTQSIISWLSARWLKNLLLFMDTPYMGVQSVHVSVLGYFIFFFLRLYYTDVLDALFNISRGFQSDCIVRLRHTIEYWWWKRECVCVVSEKEVFILSLQLSWLYQQDWGSKRGR